MARISNVFSSLPALGECFIRPPGNGCGSCAGHAASCHHACGHSTRLATVREVARTVHELCKPIQGSVAKGALRFGNLKLSSRIASSVQMTAEPIQQVSVILSALLLIPIACCWGNKLHKHDWLLGHLFSLIAYAEANSLDEIAAVLSSAMDAISPMIASLHTNLETNDGGSKMVDLNSYRESLEKNPPKS